MVEEQNLSIPWTAISKKMGKRSRLSCFKKWQKLTGLSSEVAPPMDEVTKEEKAVATAAAAVAAAGHAIDFANATDEDIDVFLLTELVNQGNGKDAPDWSIFHMIPNPEDRWGHLFNEWQMEEVIAPEELEKYTFFDIAQILLERKQRSGDAKLAAATVEAVGLPAVNLPDAREV